MVMKDFKWLLATCLGLCLHGERAISQIPSGWLNLSTNQNLPDGWGWSADGQLRTFSGQARWSEGILDVGMERSIQAMPGLSLGGQWRTAWEWPLGGGWTTSWRWATSVRWKMKVGDHRLSARFRHQFGGPWMRSLDGARWRVQAKWTHDLPEGWKIEPAMEVFWNPQQRQPEMEVEQRPVSLRGRIMFDKKLAKRKHLKLGYQVQNALNVHPSQQEHAVLLALDLEMKKRRKRNKKAEGS